MHIGDEIRGYIAKKGKSASEVSRMLNDKRGENKSPQTLNKKLSAQTIQHKEVLEIADLLGYEIIWRDKKD